MTSTFASHSNGRSDFEMTLLVSAPGGEWSELFVQHGLTIGRAKSNAICIDHPDVDHIHARVLRDANGEFKLHAELSGTLTTVAGEAKSSIVLDAGVDLRFGDTTVTCRRAGSRAGSTSSPSSWVDSCCCCAAPINAAPTGDWACQGCGTELFFEKREGFEGWVPKRIGPYEVRRFIARGGMGIVLRGIDREHDQAVALKLPRTDLARDARWQRRFEAEVQALRTFVHPNLVQLRDAGRIGELRWLAMEWVDGASLAAVLDHARVVEPLSLGQIQAWMLQILAALRALHRGGVVHRDLKPANLLLRSDGTLKLADFGLAKDLDEQDSMATMTGTVVGTGRYMSPEQLAGDRLTKASDFFALGVVWHEMLTLTRPGRKLRIEMLRPDAPSEWAGAIESLLADDPDERAILGEVRRALGVRDFSAQGIAPPKLSTAGTTAANPASGDRASTAISTQPRADPSKANPIAPVAKPAREVVNALRAERTQSVASTREVAPASDARAAPKSRSVAKVASLITVGGILIAGGILAVRTVAARDELKSDTAVVLEEVPAETLTVEQPSATEPEKASEVPAPEVVKPLPVVEVKSGGEGEQQLAIPKAPEGDEARQRDERLAREEAERKEKAVKDAHAAEKKKLKEADDARIMAQQAEQLRLNNEAKMAADAEQRRKAELTAALASGRQFIKSDPKRACESLYLARTLAYGDAKAKEPCEQLAREIRSELDGRYEELENNIKKLRNREEPAREAVANARGTQQHSDALKKLRVVTDAIDELKLKQGGIRALKVETSKIPPKPKQLQR